MESPEERAVSVEVVSGGVLELSSGAAAMTFSQFDLLGRRSLFRPSLIVYRSLLSRGRKRGEKRGGNEQQLRSVEGSGVKSGVKKRETKHRKQDKDKAKTRLEVSTEKRFRLARRGFFEQGTPIALFVVSLSVWLDFGAQRAVKEPATQQL